jgi:long-subunit acyl-CoA synthetase (AMP-forming)
VIGVELQVRGTDGEVLGPNQDGEVCARGGNFMVEYWNRPDATAAAFEDGWYHTGDEGHLDEDGFL